MANCAGTFVWVLLVCLAGSGLGLVVTPSENQWVMPGSEVKLSCTASAPIHSCSWETPYGTHYPLEKGIVAEGGRLAGFDDGSDTNCGVTVSHFEARDAGDWRCHISVVSDGEAHPGDAKVSLHVATRPDSVSVLINDVELMEDIKDANGGKVVSPVACVVGKADPKPSFEWFLGSQRLNNALTQDVRNDKDGSWSQILSYEPEASHQNQTLKCKVAHVGFQKGDEREAQVTLLFDEETLNFLRKGIVEQEVSSVLQASMYPVVGVVILIAVVSVSFLLFHYKRCCSGVQRYLETRRSVERRGANPGTPSTGSTSENQSADPEQARRAEGGPPAGQDSWFKLCFEGKAKKVDSGSASDETPVPAEKMDAPEDVVVEVRLPSPEKDELAAKENPKVVDGAMEQGTEAPEGVPSEVKGRFRMFKWLKKVPKSLPEEKPAVKEEVKMEKAAAEEMGEKGDPAAADDEEVQGSVKEALEDGASPQPSKNTAV